MRFKKLGALLVPAVLATTALVTVPSGAASTVDYATCTSLASCGGMNALVAAANTEGELNLVTLPQNWANYGTILYDFEQKYPKIVVQDDNPNGSSAYEVQQVQAPTTPLSPDAVDVGTSHATQNPTLWAQYEVSNWSKIPSALKDPNGTWADDYGGYVAIGCNSAKVKVCPTSFADLLKPAYKNEVGINGDPTQTGAGFAAVYAAAIANGGSAANIQPGIDFFAKLKAAGNFVPVTAGLNTVQSGQTPIIVWWDYLQKSEIQSSVPKWKINIPTDGTYSGYYTQAIPKNSPDPAAARLWEEYVYSAIGQNLFLQGSTHPVEQVAMIANKTINKKALAALPTLPKGVSPVSATVDQQTAAAAVLTSNWASQVGSVSSNG